tara:strand:+ start:196 stop:459 length:264 start_codon:yes stop_codon:yes gene_type:complete
MNKKNNTNNLEITSEDVLIDGLSFITQKLYGFFDGKRTNIMPISELLLRLTIPSNKKEINSEDVFIAVEQIVSILDSMKKRRDSGLH